MTIMFFLLFLLASTHNAFGQENSGVALVYVEPLEFATVLAEVIEEGTQFDVALAPDIREFSIMLLMPQVRLVVFGPTLEFLNIPELYREGALGAIQWFFENGGGLVGIASAGNVAVTAELSEEVFPIFGNYLALGKFDFDTLMTVVDYRVKDPHPISEGIDSMILFEQEYVVHIDSQTMKRKQIVPDSGCYTVVYEEPSEEMPLVVAYENVGRSVTFAGLNLAEQEGPNYYGNVLYQEDFQRVFLNAISWAADNAAYPASMERREQYIADSEARTQEIAEQVEASEQAEKTQRMWLNIRRILLTIGGIVAIAVIYRIFLQ